MIRKAGKVDLPEYLSWVRAQQCPCGKPASQAHHWPIKGRRATYDDTKTIPVCVECHQRCHGTTVVSRGKKLYPIHPDEQTAAADAAFRKFIAEGPEDAVRRVVTAVRAARE